MNFRCPSGGGTENHGREEGGGREGDEGEGKGMDGEGEEGRTVNFRLPSCSPLSPPPLRETDTQSLFTVDIGPDGSYEYTGLTQKMHDFYAFSMSILCTHETHL